MQELVQVELKLQLVQELNLLLEVELKPQAPDLNLQPLAVKFSMFCDVK